MRIRDFGGDSYLMQLEAAGPVFVNYTIAGVDLNASRAAVRAGYRGNGPAIAAAATRRSRM
jgi:hypothetical protein